MAAVDKKVSQVLQCTPIIQKDNTFHYVTEKNVNIKIARRNRHCLINLRPPKQLYLLTKTFTELRIKYTSGFKS